MKRALLILILTIAMLAGCTNAGTIEHVISPETPGALEDAQSITAMSVECSGIIYGIMDKKYGMFGEKEINGIPSLSPPLEIKNAPEDTVSFAVYMFDPDAGNFIHWLAANIKDNVIPEDFSAEAGDKAVQGRNGFRFAGYGGPTPPDKDHNYQIKVYALDSELELKEGFRKAELTKALEGHVLAEAAVNGIYKIRY